MQFTEEEVVLMKLMFNPETHDMGIMLGGERAKEIFEYVCDSLGITKYVYNNDIPIFYYLILKNETLCNFFWDNNILNLSFFTGYSTSIILLKSPIAEKIWDSGKLDLRKLNGSHIHWILADSPIAKKIWHSGKLDISLFSKNDLDYLKQKFESK